jgi:hypothetical protein
MPRKKKIKVEDPRAVAQYIFRVMTLGSRLAKMEVFCQLIANDQIEFLDQIRMSNGDKNYYAIIEKC